MERSGGQESHHDQTGRSNNADAKLRIGGRLQGQSSSRSHEVVSPKPVANSQTTGNRLEVYKVEKKRLKLDVDKRGSLPRQPDRIIDPAVLPKFPGASPFNLTQVVESAKGQKANTAQKAQSKTSQTATPAKNQKSQKISKPQIKITQVTDAALKKAKKAEDSKKTLLKGSQKVEDSNNSKPKVSKEDQNNDSSKSKTKSTKTPEDSTHPKTDKKENKKTNDSTAQKVEIEKEGKKNETSNNQKPQNPADTTVYISETPKVPTSQNYEVPNNEITKAARSTEPPITRQPTAVQSPTKVTFKVERPERPEEVHIDMSRVSDNPRSVHSTSEGFQRHFVRLGFPSAPFRRIVHVTSKSVCFNCCTTFLLLLVSLLLFGPVVILVALMVPVCVIVKRMCDVCYCCRFCNHCCAFCCNEHLSSSESIWLHKSSNANPVVVQSLIIIQAGLDTDRIRDLINARVITAEDRRGNKLYPRFSEKIVPFCCGYAWVDDYHFFINNHVFNASVRLSSLEDLQEYISEMASKPLPEDHPLWEIQVYHNFGPQRDTALLFRMHPSMTDGVSMIRILQEALVDSQGVSPPSSPLGSGPAFLGTFRAFLFGPLTFCCKYLCMREDFNLLHGRHVHPSGDMIVAWSAPFSMRSATRIKQVSRCTMNELLMSVTAGNVRSYLQVSGIGNPYDMQCAIPFDFHHTDTRHRSEMGSKYSFIVLPLPTNTEGAIPRLWELKMTMDHFKRSPEAAVIKGAMWFTSATLPKSLYRKLWNNIYSKCTCLISNLAGPETNLRFASREIKCVMYWLPPLEKVAVAISFLTYGDQIRMAVIADRSVLPNPELITKDFIFQMDSLSKLLAHRRIPGEQICRRMESMQLLSSYSLSDLTVEQIQLQMSLVQQELHDLKLQLESHSARKFSHNEAHAMKKIEHLKEQFREMMVELRKKRAAENENAVVLTDDIDEELDTDRPQRPFRRRTLSMSSRMSTASVSSMVRPLSTAPQSGQPSPTHPGLPSWPGPEIELKDVERSLMKKHPGYKQRLSTMEEYDMDDGAQGMDERRYRTY
ncbi:uncharacterized protein LOC124110828 [Haliotis rufescens]|uniref:uncharacterized protein LOC124110828 n=1 Tax=Haliotis rufescens TaxID=6454 RepID=UPI00201F6C84|nr:uncharacterized protein LOC124110828 [Haliotis rufescens]XP_046326234.2 uncharacterized protein LOC124110828 [Haliotis rufescens]